MSRNRPPVAGLASPCKVLFNGCEETDMNQFGSNPIHANLTLYEVLPHQGFSDAQRAESFLIFYSPIRRGGAPG